MRFILSLSLLIIYLLSYDISAAANRIFFEDCEDTSFAQHFLERSYGTNYLTYWDKIKTDLTRSSNNSYRGKYSMTYDPWQTGNPHAVVGLENSKYGNTRGFDLSQVKSRTFYFRWYQRWEAGSTYSGENKLIYINGNGSGKFLFTLKKNSSKGFHISYYRGEQLLFNPWPQFYKELDDNRWHKIEVYFDAGTTGGANADFFVKIDDVILYQKKNFVSSDVSVESSPIKYLMGWPSNTSNAKGSQRTWLDDLEIWDGMPGRSSNLPPEEAEVLKPPIGLRIIRK